MTTLSAILSYLAALNPRGALGSDEGLLFGAPNAEARKLIVCWMADEPAIRHAIAIGADAILAHEALFYPYGVLEEGKAPDFLSWETNRARLRLLAAHGISVIRAHGTLDCLCVFDAFAELLGLGAPVQAVDDMLNIHEIEPMPYGALVEQVKRRVGLEALRATHGDPNRLVRRVGLPAGGLGLFVNVACQQKLIAHGCDVLIAGEADNYGFRFASGAGIDMIETGHETSENPGLRQFARQLTEAFPQIEIDFYENQPPFCIV